MKLNWLNPKTRIRPILQQESAECGLACIAMIANAAGCNTSLASLRSRFSFSSNGVTVRVIIEVANELGFRSRALRLELDDLKRIIKPCILHWDFCHFVILEDSSSRGVSIIDPAKGRRTLPWHEASRHFTGVAIEARGEPVFPKQLSVPKRISLSEVTGTITGLTPSILVVLSLSLALQIFVLLAPLYMQWVIDHVLGSEDTDLLTVLAGAFAAIVFLETFFSACRGWYIAYLSSLTTTQWNSNIFSHLLRLPMPWFEKRQLGDIISRANSTQPIQRTLSTSFAEAIVDGTMAFATLIMMITYSLQLTAAALVALVSYFLFNYFLFPRLKEAGELSLARSSRANTFFIETIRGIQTVRLNSAEPIRLAQLDSFLGEGAHADLRQAKLRLLVSTMNSLLFGLERVIVIWLGALLVLSQSVSLGMLVSYLSYKELFTRRAIGLVDKIQELKMLSLHLERLSDITRTQTEKRVARSSGASISRFDVEFIGVSFRYSDSDPWILRDCSFRIAEGECVALVGPSGCGKSTLAKLFLGLLPPTSGHIMVGGNDILDLPANQLRRAMSAVMQDDHVFSGSIADNISFFDSEFNPEKVELAARMAGLSSEIELMPMKYHTLVGDLGSTLSGGQRQRLVLARALYRNPRILLLDEATSHLDTTNERKVNVAIQNLSLTRLIIAHRPETIASADRVLLLRDARVEAAP